MRIACLLALLVACATQPTPLAAPPAPPVLAEPDLPAWLVGTWQAADGARETWVASEHVYWGIAFSDHGFEAMRIDRHEHRLRFTAWPEGRGGASFYAALDTSENTLRFEREAQEFPKVISYARADNVLRAFAASDDARKEYVWGRVEAVPAPALEQADRQFAADTAARGADGWTAWFAPAGALWRDTRIEGHEAVHAAISETFGNDTFRLGWAPTTSGASPDQTLGFTVGTWTGQARTQEGTFAPSGSGTYLTLWGRQPDGAFRVLFDLGSQD